MTTATETRWDNYAPTNPSLKHEHKPEFINTAPTGTVIEVWEDLYKRLPNGNWMHLEELEYTGYSYSEHREHAQSTPEQMANSISSEYATVHIIRLGTTH